MKITLRLIFGLLFCVLIIAVIRFSIKVLSNEESSVGNIEDSSIKSAVQYEKQSFVELKTSDFRIYLPNKILKNAHISVLDSNRNVVDTNDSIRIGNSEYISIKKRNTYASNPPIKNSFYLRYPVVKFGENIFHTKDISKFADSLTSTIQWLEEKEEVYGRNDLKCAVRYLYDVRVNQYLFWSEKLNGVLSIDVLNSTILSKSEIEDIISSVQIIRK